MRGDLGPKRVMGRAETWLEEAHSMRGQIHPLFFTKFYIVAPIIWSHLCQMQLLPRRAYKSRTKSCGRVGKSKKEAA